MNYYFIIYKPYLVQSQFSQVDGKQTLSDFFDVPKDVYPVGRLDHDSEGLLILTNDKQLNHRLLHPANKHERKYWVQVDGAITVDAVEQLSRGVSITVDGKPYRTSPAHVELFKTEPIVPLRNPPIRFRKEIPAPWISIVLTEGKNRQVRKMTATVGFPTLRLIRYSIETLTIDGMQPGDLISLSKSTLYKKLFHE
ncbi:pseudouridine synthase [Sediminibacterium goheungense]|uniref:Pseudouridine synthase n=1 Tax=Sediminibacterium goheungense TaxID=1086393 RepID=A0A4R6J1N4_9BACT|nr:pseudouridine synthase [Sediminibacterium goheungense]TDO29144.1 ribosomal large subunit pseudouridine synthase E [Sediminibacterium goheungense]